MNVPKNPPKIIFLKDLPQRVDELRFLVDSEFIPIVEILIGR